MYKTISWNVSVLEHLKQFNKNNIKVNIIEFVKIDDIKKNEDLNDFIKEVFIHFSKFYKVNDFKINYNMMGSQKVKSDLINLDDNQFLIDYTSSLKRNINRQPDTETDKRFLYLFNMIEDY